MKAILIFFSLITILFAQKNEDLSSSSVPLFKNDILWFHLYKVQMDHISEYVNYDYSKNARLINRLFRSGKPVTEALDQLVNEKLLIKGKIILNDNFTTKQKATFYKLRESITKKYASLGAEMIGSGFRKQIELKKSRNQVSFEYKIPLQYHRIILKVLSGKDLDLIDMLDTNLNVSSSPQEIWTAYISSFSEVELMYFTSKRASSYQDYKKLERLMVKANQLTTKSYPISYNKLSPVQKLKFDEIQAPLSRKFGMPLSREMLGFGITSYINKRRLTANQPNMTVHLPETEFAQADEILTSFLTAKPQPASKNSK